MVHEPADQNRRDPDIQALANDLADAIERGAKLRKQCIGEMFDHRRERSCALGAAFDGAFPDDKWDWINSNRLVKMLVERLPILDMELGGQAVMDQVTNWNDKDGLTREEIAARIRRQEWRRPTSRDE